MPFDRVCGTGGLPLRILLTAHQFLPEHFGGTETLTYWTARALLSLGHEVRVLTASLNRLAIAGGAERDTYKIDELTVYRFYLSECVGSDPRHAIEAEYNNLQAGRVFREILAEFRPEIVHFFHLARLSASLIDVCRSEGYPMVLTATDFWFLCPTTQLRLPDGSPCEGPDPEGVNCLRHFLCWTGRNHWASLAAALPARLIASGISACRTRLMVSTTRFGAGVKALVERPLFLRQRLQALDRVLVPTRLMERLLTRAGVSPARLVHMAFGVEVAGHPGYGSTPPCRGEGPLRVGFIGTLAEHKGPHLLIAAVRLLVQAPIELKIYGRAADFPDYSAALQTQADGDDRIRFLGTFPNEHIGEIFAGIDVLAIPSLWYENSPLVIASAQAFGCPVVATDLEGISEVVTHEGNGLLFDLGDVEGLATALQRLLREPDLLMRLRANARPPKLMAEYASECLFTYQEVIGDRARSLED